MRFARAGCTALLIALAIAFACRPMAVESPGRRLLAGRADPDPAIEAACELTGQRCTRCHDIDRVLNARINHPSHWERIINRMRMMNGSGISQADGPVILRCLAFWSFGRPGLEELDKPGSP